MEKPIIIEQYADNGEFSHWHLINPDTGDVLWSSFPEETIARGEKILPSGSLTSDSMNESEVEEVRELNTYDKCLCIKDVKDFDEFRDDNLKLVEGREYDYFYDDYSNKDAYYAIISYSIDFIPGTKGKICEHGNRSVRYMDEEEFSQHFKIL